jgi:hypothetical protein
MKQIYILLSYVFDNYLKTCKFLEVPSPNNNIHKLYKIYFARLRPAINFVPTFYSTNSKF